MELSTKEAYLKMAEEYDAEAEKWERNVERLKAHARVRSGMEEALEISRAMDIRDEMRTNARAMRRRAEKLGEGVEK